MADIANITYQLGWGYTPRQISILEEKLWELGYPDNQIINKLAEHFNRQPKVETLVRYLCDEFLVRKEVKPNPKFYSILTLEGFQRIVDFNGGNFTSWLEMTSLTAAKIPAVQRHIREFHALRAGDLLAFEAAFSILCLAVQKTDGNKISVYEFNPVEYFSVPDCDQVFLENYHVLRPEFFEDGDMLLIKENYQEEEC